MVWQDDQEDQDHNDLLDSWAKWLEEVYETEVFPALKKIREKDEEEKKKEKEKEKQNSPNRSICRGSDGVGITGLGLSAAPVVMVADHCIL